MELVAYRFNLVRHSAAAVRTEGVPAAAAAESVPAAAAAAAAVPR